jgi:PAS domain-containing protein
LTKPWDDELLRGHIADAFRSKEMFEENKRLNHELAAANAKLRELLAERERQLQRDEVVLSVVQEILQLLPLPIVGVDAEGLIVAANAEADALFGGGLALLGSFAEDRLPAAVVAGLADSQADAVWTQDGQNRRVRFARLAQAGAQGRLIFVLD